MAQSDFYYTNGGSIVMLMPVTAEAMTWVDDNVVLAEWQNKNHFAVEHRYFDDLATGIINSGMTLAEI